MICCIASNVHSGYKTSRKLKKKKKGNKKPPSTNSSQFLISMSWKYEYANSAKPNMQIRRKRFEHIFSFCEWINYFRKMKVLKQVASKCYRLD